MSRTLRARVIPKIAATVTGTGGVNVSKNNGDYVISLSLDDIGSEQGSLLTRNGANWTALPPGQATYVLTSGGASADLRWEPPGTVAIPDGSITEPKYATDSVSTRALQASSVTSVELATNSVTAPAIVTDAVTSNAIAANAVTSSEIATNAVTASEIATGAVGTDELADNAVTNVKMADNSVNTAEIVANAVTLPKLATGTTGGLITYAITTGDPTQITGTNGQVPTVQGDGTLAFADPTGGGGGGVQIAYATPIATTSGTSWEFTGIPADAFELALFFTGFSTNGTNPYLVQIGPSGGVETSGYLGSGSFMTGAATNSAINTNGFLINAGSASTSLRGFATLKKYDDATNRWMFSATLGRNDAAGQFYSGGDKAILGAINRLRLTTVGGTDVGDAGQINLSWKTPT